MRRHYFGAPPRRSGLALEFCAHVEAGEVCVRARDEVTHDLKVVDAMALLERRMQGQPRV